MKDYLASQLAVLLMQDALMRQARDDELLEYAMWIGAGLLILLTAWLVSEIFKRRHK